MLHLFRRHYAPCPHTARRYRRCNCPIWVQGTLRGESVKKSLDLRSWEAAEDLVRSWSTSGEIGVIKPQSPTVKEAVEKYFVDAEARKLRPATIGKHKNLLEKRLLPFCEKNGYRLLKQLDVDVLRKFRATWPDGALSAYKNLERLKTFFRFCYQSNWLKTNPAPSLKPPKVTQSPTMPFSREEMKKILDACDNYPLKGIYGHGNRTRLKALTLLLQYSGLRIRDAVTLEKERIKDGKLFLYTQKTGTPVFLPLPPEVTEALEKVNGSNALYFFWTGNGDPKSAVADAQRSFRKLFELAGVEGHPHMFRDTFAIALLEKGVAIETVSVLLGHSDIRITLKHYRPWVKSLQEKLEAEVKKAWA